MHNFKRVIRGVFFVALCVVISGLFNFMLVPYSYIRVDIHNIQEKKYDDIYIGTSHGKAGINPLEIDKITGRKSTNLCLGGEYLEDSYFLVKEAVRHHKPKRIIYEADPGYWVTKPSQNTDYNMIYREFPPSLVKVEYYFAKNFSADFRNTIFPWYMCRNQYPAIPSIVKTKLSQEYKNYGTKIFKAENQSYEDEGFVHINRMKGHPKSKENLILWDEEKVYQGNLEYFKKLVRYCNDNDIELLTITTPIPKETLEQYAAHYDAANKYFSQLMKQHNITYYNFNYMKDKEIDRSSEAFSDYDGHMYGDAAQNFSRILGKYLNKK